MCPNFSPFPPPRGDGCRMLYTRTAWHWLWQTTNKPYVPSSLRARVQILMKYIYIYRQGNSIKWHLPLCCWFHPFFLPPPLLFIDFHGLRYYIYCPCYERLIVYQRIQQALQSRLRETKTCSFYSQYSIRDVLFYLSFETRALFWKRPRDVLATDKSTCDLLFPWLYFDGKE